MENLIVSPYFLKDKMITMKQYDKIYIPIDEVLDNGVAVFRGPGFEQTDYVGEVKELENVIVIDRESLLDLMQEAIEGAYLTLTRDTASELLDAKINNHEQPIHT